MLKFANLTAQTIDLLTDKGIVSIPPDSRGPVKIVTASSKDESHNVWINGESHKMTLGVEEELVHVSNLPEPETGVMYIVPSLVGRVLCRLLRRDDFVIPATSSGDRPLRAENRRILAVRKLIWMDPYNDDPDEYYD